MRSDIQSTDGGVSLEVVLTGAFLGIGLAASTFLVRGSQSGQTFSVLGGWCAFALAAGLLLDRKPGSAVGRVLAGLSLVPLLAIAWTVARTSSFPDADELTSALPELAGLEAGLIAVLVPWTICKPSRSARVSVAAAVLAAGAALFTIARTGELGAAWTTVAWVLVGSGAVAFWTELLVQGRERDRTSRRRTVWLVVTLAASGAAVGGAWTILSDDVAGYVTLSSLILIALAVTRLCFSTTFRPVDEPLLDLACVLAALGAAAGMGLLVWIGARWIDLPSPSTPAAFGALLTLGVSAPAGVWLRRSALARRYGTGVISPADVATITADLNARTDARYLLDKAARMVEAASASKDVRLVLGAEQPDLGPHEVLHPLVVGGEQVGALVVVPADEEGLEPRQRQVIEQLVPTVALVARAVALAVETELARRDLSREREVERRRILNDLHDVLGPVLAGMSMRVRGAMRTQDDPAVARLLEDLAADLATSRADLRRMVSGLTPSALDQGGLESAVDKLVGSFNGALTGPRLSLDYSVEQRLPQDVQVAIYRVVAEGVTNAVRHASAEEIAIRVSTGGCDVLVEVVDDGTGGPVHPGVGLSSLSQRAEALGGRVELGASRSGGVALRLRLPLPEEATT